MTRRTFIEDRRGPGVEVGARCLGRRGAVRSEHLLKQAMSLSHGSRSGAASGPWTFDGSAVVNSSFLTSRRWSSITGLLSLVLSVSARTPGHSRTHFAVPSARVQAAVRSEVRRGTIIQPAHTTQRTTSHARTDEPLGGEV